PDAPPFPPRRSSDLSSASQSSRPRAESSRSTSPEGEYTTRASGSRKEAGSGVLALELVVIPADAQGSQQPAPRHLHRDPDGRHADRKSTRLNSSHSQ